MKQYELDGKTLKLKVKKSPLFVRGTMFLFAFLFFIMPLTGMLLYMASGNGFHIGFAIGMFFFGLLGFYLLRIALWHTFGSEVLTFSKKNIEYVANYGWFKDGMKQIEIQPPMVYSIEQMGYIDENKGGLIIGEGETQIACVTKMPKEQLEELIDRLKSSED